MNLPSGALRERKITPNEAHAAGAAVLRAFARIAELWHLSVAEQFSDDFSGLLGADTGRPF